jgi:hypothetical protein
MTPDFQPKPPLRRRSILRWIPLFIHALLFALVILAEPMLRTSLSTAANNVLWLLLLLWGLLLVVHLLIVSLLELREGVIIARRHRHRRKQYEAMQIENRRRQMRLAVNPTPRVYDEDDLEPRLE